jgi:hypothetical protein
MAIVRDGGCVVTGPVDELLMTVREYMQISLIVWKSKAWEPRKGHGKRTGKYCCAPSNDAKSHYATSG